MSQFFIINLFPFFFFLIKEAVYILGEKKHSLAAKSPTVNTAANHPVTGNPPQHLFIVTVTVFKQPAGARFQF